jgi:hypothetical protein
VVNEENSLFALNFNRHCTIFTSKTSSSVSPDLNLDGNEGIPQSVTEELQHKMMNKKPATIEYPSAEHFEMVGCDFSKSWWQFTSSNLYTCDLSVSSNLPGKSIKDLPGNNRVLGLNLIDNKKIRLLPMNVGKVKITQQFSIENLKQFS